MNSISHPFSPMQLELFPEMEVEYEEDEKDEVLPISIIVPPIKCQGIKTKLVPFIKKTVSRYEEGIWIEPFVGTGVVAFNMAPQKAILADKNQYIISLYQKIQSGIITPIVVRQFLEHHGALLRQYGKKYYLEMRDSFNQNGDPLYFLFLNRSDFNGMIRFNRSGEFNVPFCQKPDRFSKAYITKICNQVARIASVMQGKEWIFKCGNWQDSFADATENDYILTHLTLKLQVTNQGLVTQKT